MIFADPRVGSKQRGEAQSHNLTGALQALGMDVELTPLEFGDFAFLGNGPEGPLSIGIELKRIEDFVTSMVSGRLAGFQIPGLVTKYPRAYLIVQGEGRAHELSGLVQVRQKQRGWRTLYNGKRPIAVVDMARYVCGLEETGVRVRYTKSSEATAYLIAKVLYPWWNKVYDDHSSINTLYRPAVPLGLVAEDSVTRQNRMVVSSLPGIGWKRSKAIVERFGSIYGLVTAAPDAWEGIPGVGKGIIAGVQKAIREEIPRFEAVSEECVSAGRGAPPRSIRYSRQRQR
jgi:ERCC4-type nuclease